ncbi:energy transducer TonB [Chryseobacterium foetidum]|uniref:energy transducer TonB n=1 Tax=Chryseobacterium foetidum TaxID=2951057 RepID=UPI0021C8C982|nr:energy transducer TonB [Chryseobacterium foetidum]
MKKLFIILMLASLGVNTNAQTKPSSETTAKPQVAKTVEELPDYAELQKKLDLKDVVTMADEEPEYPGGKKLYLYKVSENMPIIDIKNKEQFSTTIYVIVEKDGYVRKYAAISKNKKHAAAGEEAVKKVFERWKPAKVGGKPVRYIFYIPIGLRKW